MAFALEVPASEELIDLVPFPELKNSRWYSYSARFAFAFAVTKEAVYLATRKKGFVIRDPFETTRVPLSTIRGVSLEPAPILTANMAFWLLLTLLYGLGPMVHFAREREWHGDIFYLAPLILISLVPIISGSRGRYRLRIDTFLSPETLDFWPRPEQVSSAQKKTEALEAQIRFLDACRRVGLSVADSRT